MKMNFTWPFKNSDKKNPGRGSLRLDRNYRDVNYRNSIRVTRGIICSTALLGTPRFFALVGEYVAGQVCAAVSDRAVSLVSQPLFTANILSQTSTVELNTASFMTLIAVGVDCSGIKHT